MFSTAKFALAAALVLAATLSASAATKAHAMQGGQAAAQAAGYDVIPGYGKDGGRVAVPNPNR